MRLPNNMDEIGRIALFAPDFYARCAKQNEDALKRHYEDFKSQAVAWNDTEMAFKPDLIIDGKTYTPTQLFPDLPPIKWEGEIPISVDERRSSECGNFHYFHARFPAGLAVETYSGLRHGHCWFTKPITCPILARGRIGYDVREDEARVMMSCMPMELFTQSAGVRLATGTVLVGGLGLGHFLNRVCSRKSVKRVIVVEREQSILDWLGPVIRDTYTPVVEKVTDWICGDVYDHIGKHGDDTRYLLDIWDKYREYDRRFAIAKSKVKYLWGWGQFKSD